MTEVKTRKRECDNCGADLTQTDGPYDWHLVVSGEFTPSTSRIGYDPHPNPPRDTHFCGEECLRGYLEKTKPAFTHRYNI